LPPRLTISGVTHLRLQSSASRNQSNRLAVMAIDPNYPQIEMAEPVVRGCRWIGGSSRRTWSAIAIELISDKALPAVRLYDLEQSDRLEQAREILYTVIARVD
jgi:hypothetical protein